MEGTQRSRSVPPVQGYGVFEARFASSFSSTRMCVSLSGFVRKTALLRGRCRIDEDHYERVIREVQQLRRSRHRRSADGFTNPQLTIRFLPFVTKNRAQKKGPKAEASGQSLFMSPELFISSF